MNTFSSGWRKWIGMRDSCRGMRMTKAILISKKVEHYRILCATARVRLQCTLLGSNEGASAVLGKATECGVICLLYATPTLPTHPLCVSVCMCNVSTFIALHLLVYIVYRGSLCMFVMLSLVVYRHKWDISGTGPYTTWEGRGQLGTCFKRFS